MDWAAGFTAAPGAELAAGAAPPVAPGVAAFTGVAAGVAAGVAPAVAAGAAVVAGVAPVAGVVPFLVKLFKLNFPFAIDPASFNRILPPCDFALSSNLSTSLAKPGS